MAKLARSRNIDRLRIESWETQEDLKSKLFEVISDELTDMNSANDVKGFGESLGGTPSDGDFVWYNLEPKKRLNLGKSFHQFAMSPEVRVT